MLNRDHGFFAPIGKPRIPHSRGCAFLLILLCVLTLSACGKKPGYVDPPADLQHDNFPRIYPNPSQDPQPEKPQ